MSQFCLMTRPHFNDQSIKKHATAIWFDGSEFQEMPIDLIEIKDILCEFGTCHEGLLSYDFSLQDEEPEAGPWHKFFMLPFAMLWFELQVQKDVHEPAGEVKG